MCLTEYALKTATANTTPPYLTVTHFSEVITVKLARNTAPPPYLITTLIFLLE